MSDAPLPEDERPVRRTIAGAMLALSPLAGAAGMRAADDHAPSTRVR